MSNESGTHDLYVRAYGEAGGHWLIARSASDPTWSPRTSELVFIGADQRLMASRYRVDGNSFRAEPPRPWAPIRAVLRPRGPAGGEGRAYDLHPDGTRAIGAWLRDGESPPSTGAPVFIFNFLDEVRRLTASAR